MSGPARSIEPIRYRTAMNLSLFLLFALLAFNLSAEPFSISLRAVTIPESGEVTYNVIRTARHEFSFLPPSGWKAETDIKARTVTWTSTDYRSVIRLKISDDKGDQVAKLQTEQLRQMIATELPGAKITQEFPCYTSGASGQAFDSERTLNDQFPVTTRMAFVPVVGGFVQFNLTAPREQFTALQIDFGRFLNSFRNEKLASKER
jgi:hypothetical protein